MNVMGINERCVMTFFLVLEITMGMLTNSEQMVTGAAYQLISTAICHSSAVYLWRPASR